MKPIHIRKRLLCIFIMLAIALSFSGPGFAAGEGAQANLTLPGTHQVYKPGEVVEISGTAAKVTEVSLVVRNPQGELLFAAQPRVANNTFATSFTLESGAAEGQYSIKVGGLGLQVKSYTFTVSEAGGAAVQLNKPLADASFKPGDIVEIAGTAQKVNNLFICVRNSKNGRVFAAQPSLVGGEFATRFTLPSDAVAGKYNIAITGAGLAGAQNYSFSLPTGESGPGGEPEPKKDAILFINGSGVTQPVSYTRAELESMNQVSQVLSATSDRPEDLVVAVQGIPLRTLLDQAGVSMGSARVITFSGTDGYAADFTVDELFYQTRYIFPGKTPVEPIVALKRAERSSSMSDLSTQDTPVLCYGQRAKTEQTLIWFVKRLKTITVSTRSPGQWLSPVAKITTPDSSQKIATQGGEVKSGSKIYLESSEPLPRIYYTTDGSQPNLNSPIFNPHGCGPEQGVVEPVVITANTTVKAMAVGRGKQNSPVATFTFKGDGTIVQPILPKEVVKLQVDEKNIKRQEQTLKDGRKIEEITLLPGTLNDIEEGIPGSRLTISSTGDADEVRTEIPADILQKALAKEMLLGIDTPTGSYTMPLQSLDLSTIAASMGVKAEELGMNIVISTASQERTNQLTAQLNNGQNMLVNPVEFTVVLTAPNGKKTEYKSFGTTYVERGLVLPASVDASQTIGAVWNDQNGQFLPLPTLFETRDGKNYAVILSRTNSLYTVLQSQKTFADIKDHWAQKDIELLAAKMLISGKSKTSYEPGANITRAEFATLLVRALGLEEKPLKEGQFKDVAGTDWYAGSIAAATAENIISGYDGQLFKPRNNITREEMAVMIARAARVAGKENILSASDQEQQLARFKDQTTISSWAESAVAQMAGAGIINGMPGGELSPKSNADRAQSAVILKNFLIYVNFMNAQQPPTPVKAQE